MNFLLHRHVAILDLGSPAAGIGAMLPDLWRMAHRRQRARAGVAPGPDDPNVLRALLAGVAHHLDADRWFHASDVFHQGDQFTRTCMAEAGAPPESKLFLLAHPLWEMALDGALLDHEGLAPMRTALDGDRHTVAPYLPTARLRHAPRAAPGLDHAAVDQRIGDLLADVARGGWIDGYRRAPGLIARLEGIRRRVGLAPLDDALRARLVPAVGAVLDQATKSLPALLEAWHRRPRTDR